MEAAGRYFAPYRMVFRLPPEARPPAGTAPAESATVDTARAWLCTEGRCLPPVTEAQALTEQLAGRG
jgi:uncharacterized protein YyaL (SSP411 family)